MHHGVVPLLDPMPQALKMTLSTSPEPPTRPVCRVSVALAGMAVRTEPARTAVARIVLRFMRPPLLSGGGQR
jgi:hypothetical protein